MNVPNKKAAPPYGWQAGETALMNHAKYKHYRYFLQLTNFLAGIAPVVPPLFAWLVEVAI